jgi:hypothetical protein
MYTYAKDAPANRPGLCFVRLSAWKVARVQHGRRRKRRGARQDRRQRWPATALAQWSGSRRMTETV